MAGDRIEKRIVLHASHQTVWRAISDASRFGAWFGAAFDGPFADGTTLTAEIVPTTVDPDVAKLQAPHAGKRFEVSVERIEPMHRCSFRWHPFAIDAGVDYSLEPTTLIVFQLDARPGGVLLTISESGFEQIPVARRAPAFAANDAGWEHQARLLEKYLTLAAAR